MHFWIVQYTHTHTQWEKLFQLTIYIAQKTKESKEERGGTVWEFSQSIIKAHRDERRESLKSIVSELIVNELGLESDGYKSRVFIRKIRGQGALAQDVSKETTVRSVSCQGMPQKILLATQLLLVEVMQQNITQSVTPPRTFTHRKMLR